ncbi:ankyrin repeat domain-containing protein [Flammeovirga yaeyamensis]|uniref:Ankyrin repeat domain-containing protein n=1 Tax=Flammeovirga yaeyamensis TaxID=367791 RepID=A0AAX1NDZ2_9BACT|nr:ankyrin repeat domain-containing protein [Flammeovirga yaeyamensis]MBB3696804.1 hypothetical protein [Flammeovirga yaeyamensis]NMF33470.1 ankyrin repeat domain-containing protein [Flammeovirga yaeyamensis]QWG05256.1 ankyrin repeat domain-containing protein [Flammeovirga yaeyamensis]
MKRNLLFIYTILLFSTSAFCHQQTSFGNEPEAPCKIAIRYQESAILTEKLNKVKSEFETSKNVSLWAYKEAVTTNNYPLVKFYIEETNLLKEKSLVDLVFVAVQNGYIDIVQLFLDNGVDPNGKTKSNFYLIYRAVLFPEIMKLLHQSGAELNPKGYSGTTTLMHAAREGCLESVEYLVENGANVKDKSDDGKTVIDFAKFNEANAEGVLQLLKNQSK